jgi:NAD(P)-dependent dehydrogenase (short-subunit alcohol dehydrogenase family)
VLIGQLLVGGVFGNLVSKWPLQGSVYAWSRELIGPRYGWFTGWAYMWGLTLTLAVLPITAAPYILSAAGVNSPSQITIELVAIGVLLFGSAGAIVAISSELALAGSATDLHYVAAKGAVLGLVKSLAMEVAQTDIRVNAVAPGPTDTPLLAPDSLWRKPDYLATLPLGRLVTPEEIAHAVYYLATEGSMYCGEVLSPNAGAVI